MPASFSADSPSEIVHSSGISGLTIRQPSVLECSVSWLRGNPFSGLSRIHGGRLTDSNTPPSTATKLPPAAEHGRGAAHPDHAARLHRGIEARAAQAVDGAAGHGRRQAG